jgi:hypothetical protein
VSEKKFPQIEVDGSLPSSLMHPASQNFIADLLVIPLLLMPT